MIRFIKERAEKTQPVNIVLAAIIIAAYRVNILFATTEIYGELKNISLLNMLSHSMAQDCLALLIIASVFLTISLLPLSRRAEFTVTAILLSVIHIFYTFCENFFATYETTFSTKYLAGEMTTAVSEMAISILSETPPWVYVHILIGIIIIIAVTYFTEKMGQPRFLVEKRYLKIILPISLLLLLLPFATRISPSPQEKEKSMEELMSALGANPLVNLLMGSSSMEEASPRQSGTGKFQWGFNTQSLTEKGRLPRINVIPRGKRYNIIYYFFESTPTKYFDMKVNGKWVMPQWHKLMKNSLSFMNHYANYPLSANAMLSLFTSAYSYHKKNLIIQKYSSIKLDSLPEILKREGYRTAVVHTGDLRYAGQRRFLSYRSIDRIIDLPELENIPPWNFKVGWGVDERAMIAPSIEFMKKSKKPFFITYMPCNPHHPYAIPDDCKPIVDPTKGKTSRERTFLKYLNSLHYADFVLGQLVAKLEEEGLMENTILFLLADHGEAFYQHRQNYNHPFFLYEENVHVPMLIYNKKLITSPKKLEAMSRHVDLPATVLDILNLKKPKTYEGKSLLASRSKQLALLHTSYRDDIIGVRDGKWKYMRNMATGKEELYDLESDPDEKLNLATKNQATVLKFRKFVKLSRQYMIEFYERMFKKSNLKK